jgi:lathosterol oxidase
MAALLARMSFPELVLLTSAFFVGCTLLGLALGFATERALPSKRIWSDALPEGQLRHEAIGNVVFVLVTIASFTLVLSLHLVRFAEPSLLGGVLTFFALNVGFQIHFYFLHRALHHPKLLRFHRWHHVSRVTTPLSGQSVHLVEALGWMGGYVVLPVLLSRIVPISAEGFVSYMAFNVIGNIVGHANVEVVPVSKGLRTRSLAATVFTYHALHHLRYTGHFGFACTWLDRLLGTEWPDWMALHAQVDGGTPLTLRDAKHVREGADAAYLAGQSRTRFTFGRHPLCCDFPLPGDGRAGR